MMTLDELEDVIDVVLANYNGEPHGGLGGRTPLEAMQYLLTKQDGLLRTLPVARRSTLCLLQEAHVVTIRGNVSRGDRPHVNFEHVRYDSRVLSGIAGLVGKQLRIYFNVKDIRHLHAFHMDGSELGVLTAARPWCFTPHSLRVRQEIFSLIISESCRCARAAIPLARGLPTRRNRREAIHATPMTWRAC